MANTTRPSGPAGLLVALAAAAVAAVVAYRRRPVRPPETTGTWHPARSEEARR